MLSVLLATSLAVAVPLDDDEVVDPASPHVDVSLVLDTQAVARGSHAWLGVSFDIDEHWHLYWPGLNDSGLPIALEPTLPEGFELGLWRWPAPVRHVSPGDILDHVYEGRVTLCAPLRVADDVALGTHEIRVEHDWLVCREACMFGGGKATLDVEVVEAGVEPAVNEEAKAWFQASVARWPGVARDPHPPARAPAGTRDATERIAFDMLMVKRSGQYTQQFLVDEATRLVFHPYEDCTPPQDLLQHGAVDGERLELTFDTAEPVIHGVLEIHRPDEAPEFWPIDLRDDLIERRDDR